MNPVSSGRLRRSRLFRRPPQKQPAPSEGQAWGLNRSPCKSANVLLGRRTIDGKPGVQGEASSPLSVIHRLYHLGGVSSTGNQGFEASSPLSVSHRAKGIKLLSSISTQPLQATTRTCSIAIPGGDTRCFTPAVTLQLASPAEIELTFGA